MSEQRTKKRQWRPKPTDNNQLPPKRKRPFITVRIADPRAGDSHRQEATNDQAKESGTKTVETPVKDRFHWSKPKLEETATTKSESKLQEPEINNSIPTTSPLHVAVYIKGEDDHKRNVIFKGQTQESVQTNEMNKMNARDCLAKSVQKEDHRKDVGTVETKLSETRSTKTPVGDKFHWSRLRTLDDKTTNKLNTKATVSQLAGFLKKQSPPKITLPSKETSAKTSSVLQSRIRAEHTTGLDLNSQPLGVKHDKKVPTPINLDDDFDYSLDLMGDCTLKIKDAFKKPTPLLLKTGSNNGSVQLSTTDTTQTDQSGQAVMTPNNDFQDKQFIVGEIDLSDLLPVPEVEEYDIIMESRRGYTYHTNSIYRGIKRKVAFDYDDMEDVSPSKRSRMY